MLVCCRKIPLVIQICLDNTSVYGHIVKPLKVNSQASTGVTFSTHNPQQLFLGIFIIYFYKKQYLVDTTNTKVHSGVEIQSAGSILSVSVKLDISDRKITNCLIIESTSHSRTINIFEHLKVCTALKHTHTYVVCVQVC